jgi:D-alanine transaminase
MISMVRIDTFVNGEFTTAEKACLSVEDRGMLFGDGVYEFTRCYVDGVPYQLEEHLQRFLRSAAEIDLKLPYSKEEMKAIILDLLRKSGLGQAGIYFQATRGYGGPRNHCFPAACQPSFFVIVRELEPESPDIMGEGVKVITLPDQRWSRCDIKSLNLLPNILAKEQATRQGAYEAILYREYGVTEASHSSVFIISDGHIHTTPEGSWILPGITSQTVVQLAREKGYPVHREFSPREKLYTADELFITSSRLDIIPVNAVDGRKIGDGKPGPITRDLKEAFRVFSHRL